MHIAHVFFGTLSALCCKGSEYGGSVQAVLSGAVVKLYLRAGACLLCVWLRMGVL